jgi:WD40 repeat protein
VGKSSVVLGGLLPLLKAEGWNSLGTIKPGVMPLSALAAILSEVPGTRLAERITSQNALAGALAGATPTILVVDQFEELVTSPSNELERTEFLAQILEALGDQLGQLHVVVTLRSDFEAQFALPPSLMAPMWATAARFVVPPMQPHELREVIERPAAVRALFFESDNLVSHLIAEVDHAPGALPLLSFALAALYDLYVEHARNGDEQGVTRTFTEQDYKRLGGVTTALAMRANQQYKALDPPTQQTMKRLMLRMVSLEGDEPSCRRVLLDELDYEDPAEKQRVDTVIRKFVVARLLVAGVDTLERAYVEPAHDALIYGWQMLWDLITASKDLIMLQRRLNQAAANWSHAGHRHADLWSNNPLLTSLEHVLHANDNWLNRLEADFVRRSARQRSINRRLRLVATLVLLSLTIAVSIVLQLQQLETQRRTREAEQADRTTKASRLSTESRAALDQLPQRSLLLAVEALTSTMVMGERPLPAAEESLRQALAFTGGRPMPGLHTLVDQLASSRDGRWLISAEGDHTIRLRDLAAPKPQASTRALLSGYTGLPAGNFSLDGNWLALSDARSKLYLWNLQRPDGPTNPLILPDQNRKINSVKLSPDLHWLVATHDDSSIYLWDLNNITPATKPHALLGHTDWVSAVTFSSDGQWMATSSSDGTIRLWDLHASDPSVAPVILRVVGERFDFTAFSPDNKWLIGRSIDVVCLWSLSGDGLPRPAGVLQTDSEELFDGPIPIFSPDSHWLIVGSRPAKVRLLDLRAPSPTEATVVLGGNEGLINAMVLSNDGRWLATAGTDQMARLWDLGTTQPVAKPLVLQGHTAEITSMAISPDGRRLITGSRDHTARVWDLTSSNPAASGIVLHGHDDEIATVAVSSDSRRLVVSAYRSARTWDLAALDPPEPRLLRGHTGRVSSVVTGPDGEWLASGSADGTAILWRLAEVDHQVISTTLRGHEDAVRALSMSTDGRWLATGSADRTIRLWDLQSPELASTLVLSSDSGITSLALSPDNRWVAASDELQMAHLWSLAKSESGALPFHFPDQANILAPVVHGPTLAFSPDSRLFARAKTDNAVGLYDLTAVDPSATEVELVGHTSTSFALAFGFDSHRLATGSNDHTTRLWEITNGSSTVNSVILSGHEDTVNILAFSPDNHWLATGSIDQTVRLWDLQHAAAMPVVLRGHSVAITGVVFSPDNHWLITGSADGIIRIWDVTSNDIAGSPTVLQAQNAGITGLAISSDSHWLVTAAEEPTIRLWDLRLDELMDLACSTAGRNLTAAEWQQYMGQAPYRETCP